ncbi:hypothetical protein LCGC14_1134360 [marine sediment metagenome]|uniref:Cytochrome c assembly protein domain-containing protein n=1 Tax=marine sediment metagenome TaxID=412755 RepID=A0A0F9MN44_9ZZZZ
MLKERKKFFKTNFLLMISLVMLLINLLLIVGLTSTNILTWREPPDSHRIVYIVFFYHVSGAWLAYFSFGVSLISHIMYLKNKRINWSLLGKNSIIVGVFFTTFALITGSLWYNSTSGSYGSNPGDYWQWGDGRQTMTLVLLMSYLAFLIFRSLIEDKEKKAKISAALGIVLFPAIPLSYLSGLIFSSLHPLISSPDLVDYGEPLKIFILLFNLIAITILFIYLVQKLYKLDMKTKKLNEIIQKRLMED